MASMNKVLIMGNLGGDPEFSITQGGQPVCHFNVATNDTWTDKTGNRQERTEWHRVVVWGRQAEQCNQYLRKGRTVFVEGRIQSRNWEDKQGQKRTTVEINASNVQFIGGSGPGGGAGRGPMDEPPLVEPQGRMPDGGQPIADDDVPF
jgi:single-strand DNA-binding protein